MSRKNAHPAYAYPPSRVSPTGKALCIKCRHLATHEGCYHRSSGAPACLYACAKHAAEWPDALPLKKLAREIGELGELMSIINVYLALQQAGVSCSQDAVQNALWLRYPDRFLWTEAWRYDKIELPTIPADSPFQQKMNSLLINQADTERLDPDEQVEHRT